MIGQTREDMDYRSGVQSGTGGGSLCPAHAISGTELAHGIPTHWRAMPVKRLMANTAVRSATEGLPFVALEHIEAATGRVIPGFEWTLAAPDDWVAFEPGDVLFGKLRPYLRKFYHADRAGCCSSELLVLRPMRGVCCSRYLFYLVQSEPFISVAVATSYGTKMPRTAWEKLCGVYFGAPPILEQRAITAFLDRETARIDALIAKKERLIALLEEKRAALISHAIIKGLSPNVRTEASGVPWIGDVPAHWAVAPLYSRYLVQLGKMLDTARITGQHLAPYLRNVDVQWGRINTDDLPVMDFCGDDKGRFLLRRGDLLVCEGGEVGRAALWCSVLPECYYQKALHRLRPFSKAEDARFMYYVLYAAARAGVFVAQGNPNTIDHLTAEKLRQHRFPFPPPDEQRMIADHLDARCGKIATLSTKIREQIDKLQERRVALISAAVTGQIDVRGEAA